MVDGPEGLVRPFPAVGELMGEAYADLRFVEKSGQLGLASTVATVGTVEELPRPWQLATCDSAALRGEVWAWLDAVVDWLNSECVWLTDDAVPGCWPLHPHLVHELGTLADQRRRAAQGLTSDLLEDWHRYSLPAFLERSRSRTGGCCETGHTGPPAEARIDRYRSDAERNRRADWFLTDSLTASVTTSRRRPTPRLVVVDGQVVDPLTGEIP